MNWVGSSYFIPSTSFPPLEFNLFHFSFVFSDCFYKHIFIVYIIRAQPHVTRAGTEQSAVAVWSNPGLGGWTTGDPRIPCGHRNDAPAGSDVGVTLVEVTSPARSHQDIWSAP